MADETYYYDVANAIDVHRGWHEFSNDLRVELLKGSAHFFKLRSTETVAWQSSSKFILNNHLAVQTPGTQHYELTVNTERDWDAEKPTMKLETKLEFPLLGQLDSDLLWTAERMKQSLKVKYMGIDEEKYFL